MNRSGRMKVLSCLSGVLLIAAATVVNCAVLDEKFVWRELEFSWPSEDVRRAAIESGSYEAQNNLPLAFDVWRDKLFLTVPRCVFSSPRSCYL